MRKQPSTCAGHKWSASMHGLCHTHTHTTPYRGEAAEAREKWVLGGAGSCLQERLWEKCGFSEPLPKGWAVSLDLQGDLASHKWDGKPLSLLVCAPAAMAWWEPALCTALVFPWGLDRGRRAWAASSVHVLTAASHARLCVTIGKPILLSLWFELLIVI